MPLAFPPTQILFILQDQNKFHLLHETFVNESGLKKKKTDFLVTKGFLNRNLSEWDSIRRGDL